MEPPESWTPAAARLVQKAIAAHGGIEAWRNVRSITLPLLAGRGPLLSLKGYGSTFPPPRAFETFPHDGTTIFHDYPETGCIGRFSAGEVRIERGGTVVERSRGHRRTFGAISKYRRWSTLDALFFFGYAVLHYHTMPFNLVEARLVRTLARRGVSEGLDVEFPPSVETHCARQRIYFGPDGRIVRHDYVAEIAGSWARGSHYWLDYRTANGLAIACHRRVTARIGSWPIGLAVMDMRLGEPVVTQRG